MIGEQDDETERTFFEKSVHNHAPLYYAQSLWGMVRVKQDARYQYFKAVNNATMEMTDLKTDLLGNYQQHNIKTILTCVELLAIQGFKLSLSGAMESLAYIKKTTGLRGRFDCISEKPLIICDVAHNPAGLGEVLQQFNNIPATSKHIILGFVKDKDVDEALSLFPKDAHYYFCNAQIQRALPAPELKEKGNLAGLNGEAWDTVDKALEAAKMNLGENDALLITGSFFIVGEAMDVMER